MRTWESYASIYVHPDHWDSGVGARLHDAAMQALRECGFREATLWVLDINERARLFYERRGWFNDGGIKHEERDGVPLVEWRYRRLDLD